MIQKFAVEFDGETSIVLGATADMRELLVVKSDKSLALVPLSRCKFIRPLFGVDDSTFQAAFLPNRDEH